MTESDLSSSPPLLEPETAAEYLRQRGLLGSGTVKVRALSGGVSSVVLAATDRHRSLVLKQALPRLRVADEWLASQSRTLTEGEALTLASELVPGAGPAVVDVDPDRFVLVQQHAPETWSDWKSLLMKGSVDPEVAVRLGQVLAALHSRTWDGAGLTSRMDDTEPFDQLRVDPYYRTVARRRPELARPVLEHLDRMLRRRHCLVHGDFSPKNVLVGPAGGVWLIDYEVAHRGDPVFDVAFLLTHLALKSLHRPENQTDYDECVRSFVRSYTGSADPQAQPDWPYVMGHVGCLLLARVHGKSPVEYLDDRGRERAHRLGSSLLESPPDDAEGLLRRREAAA